MAKGGSEAGDDAAAKGRERWREFLKRLDALDGEVQQLNQMVYGLHELGNLILLALQEAAAQRNDPLMNMLNKAIDAWKQMRR